ncbi:sensor histidine kinase [Dokdonia sp. Hel_I_53]|uniref:sensor histidine kinase n=1 Tax=Dokdonia sp. Hel_I_53 TaxID=1566287 RepID=UPI00119930E7|nr:HAMP domain-containing sensor histidine kinase [Dokdonia sp. Hel_I_53]TVZ52604.1 phospho-acceptor domain-containing protein [Dokdonia sp. Hel_I_53]
MSVNFPKKYYIVLALLALVTAIVLYWGTSDILSQEKFARKQRLEIANRGVSEGLENAFKNYATLLSGLKSHIELTNIVPPEDFAKTYLENQTNDLNTNPPFCVSYVDTNHIFIYDFTMQETKSLQLAGKSIESIIGKSGIERMDTLITSSDFYVSNPTNLLEGRVGLPVGFGIVNNEGVSLGYISSVVELGPIMDDLYLGINIKDLVFKFQSNDGSYFDRTRAYNGQKVFAKEKDPQYYKNFDIHPEQFIASTFSFYNKKFIVSSAYKSSYKENTKIIIFSLALYVLILGFMLLLTVRYYIYKRKNRLIAAQKKRLTSLVETKNKFFSIIAHDLRSPLSSIINFLDVLNDEKIQNEETKAIMKSLECSSRNSIILIDNLLKWSKLQKGQIKYNPEEIDILSITKDQIKAHQQGLLNKSLNIRVESSFNSTIVGDKNMISTVIGNLISNAIKFSYENEIIVVELSKIDNNFTFSIEDTGTGISESDKSKLFNLKGFVAQEGAKKEKGSGLGLVLSFSLVKIHKGSLHIDSEIGKGTIVTFTLPLS